MSKNNTHHDANDIAKTFMVNKNKEVLGEATVEETVDIDDTFLPDKEEASAGAVESANDNAEAELMLKKVMRIVVSVPVLMGAIVSVSYIFIQVIPHILSFFRTFLRIMMGFN